MQFTTVLFDLDGTLYTNTTGLWQKIKERITCYLTERMGFTYEEQEHIRDHYLKTYGTTLRGLQENYHVDTDDYLAFVHDVPLEEFITPDPELRSLLLRIKCQKWIFSNADNDHVMRVSHVLGIQDCFDGIIDIRKLGFVCKPDIQAYHKALQILNQPLPSKCVFIDDAERNLVPARELGMYTVQIIENGNIGDETAQARIHSIHELPQILPELWD